MTNFAAWWRDFGSAMRPGPNEDTEEFAMRVASSAWHNSKDAAFTACESAQGQADGAALCLEAIKARRSA
jgi:hypothetical protein